MTRQLMIRRLIHRELPTPELPGHERPQRTCCACGAKRPQRELLRVASLHGAAPRVDEQGKEPGRGAYLCVNGSCVEKALQRRGFERALKLKSTVQPDFSAAVRAAIESKLQKEPEILAAHGAARTFAGERTARLFHASREGAPIR